MTDFAALQDRLTAVVMQRFGVSASWTPSGGLLQPGRIILDEPDSLAMAEMVIADDKVMTFPISQWFGIDEGAVVMVDAQGYRLRTRPMAFDDGAMVRVAVAKV